MNWKLSADHQVYPFKWTDLFKIMQKDIFGVVTNFYQWKQCFLASNWLKYVTPPTFLYFPGWMNKVRSTWRGFSCFLHCFCNTPSPTRTRFGAARTCNILHRYYTCIYYTGITQVYLTHVYITHVYITQEISTTNSEKLLSRNAFLGKEIDIFER